ncbi:Spy/CpxP family protein refolding chaperone [Candidatus Ruminimicrobiellum ovillum]|uniref:Spy/CpxP family protein refolding chaperone n=1 Tax=Candidatus Ruminimicrobiellum ovillum TaxID=1947927 RepID=UPI003559D434
MKKILSLAVALLVTTSLYAVPPQEKGDMPEPPHMHHQKMGLDFEKIAKELNITDAQKTQLNEMMKEDMSRKKELRQNIKQKMDLIDEELMKENIDMNVINKLAAEIQQTSADISRINIESKLKVRSVLSFEQYTKMEQSRKEMMAKFRKDKQDKVEEKIQPKKDKKAKK